MVKNDSNKSFLTMIISFETAGQQPSFSCSPAEGLPVCVRNGAATAANHAMVPPPSLCHKQSRLASKPLYQETPMYLVPFSGSIVKSP